MANPLDNPVWHTLRGPRTDLAEQVRGGTALRFSSEISIFAAVEHFDDDAWTAQAELVGQGGVVFLFRDRVPAPPEGWTELMRIPTLQLVAGDLAPAPDAAIVTLGDADVEEMLALTKLTEPGPFLPRTHELGTYVGVKQAGRLVAMAGERFQMPGWTEISAVCTHPDARRQGLGAALSLRVAQNIRKRGDEAFLHVIETNESALLLYESIGFRIRRMMDVVALQWGDAPA
ncbi:MAG: GNAT family N-acetyltransferase [Myxococcales bacterium]|nr:GNAT family N-acetyltransferase [Myxococcales bacterium]